MGAGRSGSTLLYKVLCLHPDIGYISNYDNRLPGWLPTGWIKRSIAGRGMVKRSVWFESDGNAYGIRRPLLEKLVPWPVEGEDIYRRCGIPLEGDFDSPPDMEAVGALAGYLERLRQGQKSRLFLNKRVANNRRISWLKNGFPDARFIHLVRDGRDVAYSFSKVAWWTDDSNVWWAGKTMGELVAEGHDRLAVTARTWAEATTKVADELAMLPQERVLELRYETFLDAPIEQMGRLLDFMGLELTPEVKSTVESLHLKGRPSGWRKEWDSRAYDLVMAQQGEVLQRFGYSS